MGNLKNTRGVIAKIRIRDRNGKLLHKAQISLDDKKSLSNEVKLWHQKFGADKEAFLEIEDTKEEEDKEVNRVKSLFQQQEEETRKKIKKFLAI